MIRRIPDPQEDLPDSPMRLIKLKVIIHQIERQVRRVRAEHLRAIQPRMDEPEHDDDPAQARCGVKGHAARGDRSVRFVQLVLGDAVHLVREVAVQDLCPEPEEDVQ